MVPLVDFAYGTEAVALAQTLADRIRINIDKYQTIRDDFLRMQGSVALVSQDTTVALTFRFDHGHVIVHRGVVGIPQITMRGDEAVLRTLTEIPFGTTLPLPKLAPFFPGWRAWQNVRRAQKQDRLTFYGFWFHLPWLLRLGRLVANHG